MINTLCSGPLAIRSTPRCSSHFVLAVDGSRVRLHRTAQPDARVDVRQENFLAPLPVRVIRKRFHAPHVFTIALFGLAVTAYLLLVRERRAVMV
jgi:hypothetical protein